MYNIKIPKSGQHRADSNAQRNALERGAFLWHCRVVHLVKHKMSHEGLEDKEEEEFFSFFALAPS